MGHGQARQVHGGRQISARGGSSPRWSAGRPGVLVRGSLLGSPEKPRCGSNRTDWDYATDRSASYHHEDGSVADSEPWDEVAPAVEGVDVLGIVRAHPAGPDVPRRHAQVDEQAPDRLRALLGEPTPAG